MKKKITLGIQRLVPLLVFLLAQARVWAIDSTTATTLDNSHHVLTQPWIWIAIVVVVIIKILGPFAEHDKDFLVVRKKPVKNGNV